MLDSENTEPTSDNAPETGPDNLADAAAPVGAEAGAEAPVKKAAAKKTAKRATTKKAAAKKATTKKAAATETPSAEAGAPADEAPPAAETEKPAKKATTKRAAAKKTTAKKATAKKTAAVPDDSAGDLLEGFTGDLAGDLEGDVAAEDLLDLPIDAAAGSRAAAPAAIMPLFKAPEPTKRASRKKKAEPEPAEVASDTDQSSPEPDEPPVEAATTEPDQQASERTSEGTSDDDEEQSGNRRRRRRGGRRRRKGAGEDGDDTDGSATDVNADSGGQNGRDTGNKDNRNGAGTSPSDDDEGSADSRRRRRRRRSGEAGDAGADDPEKTVTRVRKARSAEDEITSVTGSTRLEAKKQRRREGREAGRRRAPIVSEAEFLARREAVDRVMVIRQKKDLTQIAVLEDKVLVEHYVARESQTSLIGNVYLAKVQNVLPSMEAAFLDIGKGRNAVLYAGEVNWSTFAGGNHGGQRKIEQVLKPGQTVLVQVSKDPIGHKGARLTSQISLPGRFLVYVPDGTTSGISRKLPDTERSRLKALLKEIVPESAGVIVRTAAEGASEEELTQDVERLTARWADIESKVSGGSAPQLLYGEPDLTLKVVRDLFTEDFAKLVVSGDEAWDLVEEYVKHVAPDLEERLEKYDGDDDVYAAYRIDEQIAKGLDRKVWLPSGGSLVIDRTEAMTVVDVNTGKFTGSGGNLEETVTKNNLEAAEEIVRKLRLRDIGGIIVVDFIDMVLESNRDLVLRRMVECLGRDRTRHQVAEVTSLGLVQMTRKRIGTGLLEAFSETCEHCGGRGVVIHHEPVQPRKQDDEPRRNRRGGRGRDGGPETSHGNGNHATPSPKDLAAMAKPEPRVDTPSEPPVQEPIQEPAPAAAAVEEPARRDEPAASEPQRVQPEPAAPRTSTRRVRAQRPAGAPDAETAAQEPVVETESAPAGTNGVRQDSAEPAAPRVVTTVRRRGARREAGQPVVGDAAPAAVLVQEPPVVTESEPVVVEPAPQAVEPSAAPTIVTTVRRRGASRPAGPPQGTESSPENSSSAQTGSAGPAMDEPQAPSHVPVKKKGSRKR